MAGKKQNYAKTGALAAHQEQKRQEAAERMARRAGRSTEQQLALLAKRPGNSEREKARLMAKDPAHV